MSIVVGDATDGSVSGLAGRFNTAIKALIGGVTYVAGTAWTKSLNAFAQAIVDALNNDKIGPAQVDQLNAALGNGASPTLGITAAAGWVTVLTSSYTPKRTGSSTLYIAYLTAFASVAAGGTQMRILVDGGQVGGTQTNFYNTLAQHMAWMAQVVAASPSAGSAHTVLVQVQSTGTTVLNLDANDVVTISCVEV
jgi:hypothetical protein